MTSPTSKGSEGPSLSLYHSTLRAPRAFEIAPPLENALILEAANYKASFR